MTDAHSQIRPAPTLEAVAARAAVSRATASRVLRGAANVSSRARAAVEAAAEELSYTPNRAARSLVTGRSESVAFYVDESEDRLFSDPYFLGVLRGTQTAIAQAGMQLVFTVASTPQDHERFLRYAAGRHIDGVLTFFPGARVVFVDCDPETMAFDLADVEERLSPATAAVVAVHIGGLISPAITALAELCAAAEADQGAQHA